MFKKRLAISMFLTVLLFSTLACESLVGTPIPTATLVDTATPEPSPTPTPILELAFGQTYPGETWEITVVEFQSVDAVEDMIGMVASPNAGFELVGVTLQLNNPIESEQILLFSPDTAVLISAQGDEIPMAGATFSGSLMDDPVLGFMNGSFNGTVTLNREGVDSLAFAGGDGTFSLEYTLLPGQSGQFALIFTIEVGTEIEGLDLGDQFPLLLVR